MRILAPIHKKMNISHPYSYRYTYFTNGILYHKYFLYQSEKLCEKIFGSYLFEYGKSYYQKNFGFKYINKMHQIQQTENMKIKGKFIKNYSNILQKKK